VLKSKETQAVNNLIGYKISGQMIWPLRVFLLLFVILWVSALTSLKVVETQEHQSVRNFLVTVRDATHSTIVRWSDDHQNVVMELAKLPEVVVATQELLAVGHESSELIDSPIQKRLREILAPLLHIKQYQGYFIIDPDDVSLASWRDENIGTRNLMADQPDVMQRLWACQATMGRPIRSDVPLHDRSGSLQAMAPAMFVGSCIRDAAGQTIALLTLRINPEYSLYDMLQQARLGESGETYLFDINGGLLSPSRFANELILSNARVGINNGTEFLGLPLLEPRDQTGRGEASRARGLDSTLTYSVKSATSREDGVRLDAYLNYRGKPVVGAWLWDNELQVGLVTEVDTVEAYRPLLRMKWLVYSGSLLASFLIVVLLEVMRRAQLGMQSLEMQWRRVFDATVDGAVVIDSQGLMQKVNPAMSRLFGYSADELLGKNASMLMSEPERTRYDRHLRNYLNSGKPVINTTGGETKGLRKDGTSFPFDLSISEFLVDGERYFAGIVHDLTGRKDMEAELEAERQLNVDTLDGLAESIAVLDEQGEVIFVNKVWRDFAAANGGSEKLVGIGMNYLAVTSAAKDDVHAREIAGKLRRLLAGEINDFTAQYPCHSPEVQRWYMMRTSRFEHLGATRIAVAHQDISARILAEQALHDANEQLRIMARVAEGTHNAVVVTDPQGRITWVNQGFTDLTGYSFEEACGRKPGDLLQGPDTSEQTRKRLRQAIQWCVPIELEILNYTKDRHPYWVNLSVSPVRDETGAVVQYISIAQDISQQREMVAELERSKRSAETAAEELRKNREILNLALEGGGAGYWYYNPMSAEVTWDAQSSKIYGMEPKPFQGTFHDWAQHVYPDDLTEVNSAFMAALEDASVSKLDLEYRIVDSNGEQGYLQVDGGIKRDGEGRAIAVYGLHFDLTERWRGQQELLRAKYALEMANRDLGVTLQAMGEVGLALFWLDADSGKIIKASEFACQRLGYTEEELLQRSWLDICPQFADEVFEGGVAQIQREGFGVFEATMVTHNGEPFQAEMQTYYRGETQRQAATLITFVTDITERKQTEADLIVSREAAEAASRAKSAFLATMSHEIRTPINGVVGMAELLAETRLDNEQRNMLKSMRSSALSLQTIIDDILDFSKIEAGKLTLAPTSLSPIGLVEEVAETLAPMAAEKDVALWLDVDPLLNRCYLGDPVRIRQILFNLGSNAIKFSSSDEARSGKVILKCCQVSATATEAKLDFAVIDNGIGISPVAQERLFKPFTQAEADTTRRFGGTGLGLAITRQLTDLMGGDISVHSVQGEGSRFHLQLTLPLTDCQESLLLGNWDFSGARVLLVGVPAEMGECMARLIEAHSARVSMCEETDAIAEIEAASREQPQFAVVVDDERAEGLKEEIEKIIADPTQCVLLQPHKASLDGWDGCLKLRSYPVLPSELLRSIAIALGLASPDIATAHFAEPFAAQKAPPLDQAEAAGQLILVAEDNEINRDVIARQLSHLGYAHLAGVDGKEALALWRQRRFGLVLTDCHMPEMDGYTLSAAIRDDDTWYDRHVPIIAITANAMKGEAERCQAAGMDDYLTKPLELHALHRLLEKWLPLGASDDVLEEEVGISEAAAGNDSGPATETVTVESSVVDLKTLAAIVGDDQTVVVSFLKKFVPKAQEMVADIDHAVTASDADSVRFISHKLKGSSSAIGATTLSDLCAALEKAGREGAWTEINRLHVDLEPALQAVLKYIESV
jgi:PAS domain S-box-containing protein